MKIFQLIFLLLSVQELYARQDKKVLESIQVQKQIETQMLLDKRRKAEALKHHAQLMRKSEQRESKDKHFAIRRQGEPKNRVPNEILEKIRKAK